MLAPRELYDALIDSGVTFFAGVPDSLLKDFCSYVTDHTSAERHVITANEGSAIAMAMGYHLATGRIGLVYMQNSGLGNAVNPLTSLADPAVYGIPMLLMVGWRGEPDKKDEPQHVQMGRVTRVVLESIGVPHVVLPDERDAALSSLAQAVQTVRDRQGPFALVVKKGTFESYKLQKDEAPPYALLRERAIERFVATLPARSLVVATTGMPSRELFEVREQRGEPHDADFLTVGGMGHASQIALGLALEKKHRPVYCLDGDGAALMHLGGLATIATLAPDNYRHVVLNNGSHESVGGQPTAGFAVDLCAVARAVGYRKADRVESEAELDGALAALHGEAGPALLEVRIKKGHRKDLGRPTMTPAELKKAVMANAEQR